MNSRHVVSCGLVCAALVMTGCDKGRQDPGDVTVHIANVAPSFASLEFARETRQQPESIPFKGTLPSRVYDIDTYDFFVYERSLFDSVVASWTFSRTLTAGQVYTFVLTEVGTEVQPVVLEYPAAPAAEAQFVALHAAAGLPAMDLYLERPGVGIAGATPRGTFNAQEQIAPRTLAEGEYELWLTAAGNPADVLLATTTFTLPAATTTTFVVTPESGVGGAQLSVLLVQGSSSGVLYDRNATSELRVINAAADATPRDFVVDNVFSPPFFSAVPFAEPTAYAAIAAGTHAINVTPAGNPGVLELAPEQSIAPNVALRNTLLFAGPAGTLSYTMAADDGRRIRNEAKLSFTNAATQFTLVDFVLTSPGGDPATVFAVATLGAPGSTLGYNRIPPGDYDFYVRQTETGALLAGPIPISLAGGGIYSMLALNGPDTATATVVLYDDFP